MVDFSLTASYSYFGQVMQTLAARPKQAGAPLISSGYTKISLFGEEMVTSCGVAARAMGAVAKAGIEVVLITTSLLDISLLVRQVDEDQALQVLRETFAL